MPLIVGFSIVGLVVVIGSLESLPILNQVEELLNKDQLFRIDSPDEEVEVDDVVDEIYVREEP
jgi:hypothetical protein